MVSQKEVREVNFSRIKQHAIFFNVFCVLVLENRHLLEGNKKKKKNTAADSVQCKQKAKLSNGEAVFLVRIGNGG